MMENGQVGDILSQASQVANDHYAALELDAARSLISGAFAALPWELQEDYREIQELHRLRKFGEANFAWDLWMDKARDMGLL